MNGEATSRFACFGGECAVFASGAPRAPEAVLRARRRMLEWHTRFSRFEPGSELSRLNRDSRAAVPASPTMLRLVAVALRAARCTGGLVDPTILPALRDAGYARSRKAPGAPAALALPELLADAPARQAAAPHPEARWREVSVDDAAGTVVRPPGLELDLSGIAKGAFGDLLAGDLRGHDSFAVDAAGDVRFGGAHTLARPIAVAAPAGGVLHTFHLQDGAVATSGLGRRAWRAPDGRPAHHLIDPSRGRPAFTGLVQVSALAPSGAEAEARAKAALLGGPVHAAEWLPDGGAILADDGALTIVEPSPALLAPPAVAA